jgi:Uma2 family endonuclease
MPVHVDNKTKFTYQDYLLLPDDGRIHEIIDGDHYMSPAPGTYHQTVSRRIQFQLYQQIEIPGLGVVFNAPTDVELSQFDIVQPDLLVIPRRQSRQVSPSRILGAPDLVIEILSEHSLRRDRELKLGAYERTGVREYWIVDVEAHLVQKYVRSGERLTDAGSFGDRIEYSHDDLSATVELTQVW